MECVFCCDKPCKCHRIVSHPSVIDDLLAEEDLSGVATNKDGTVKYSSGKGGRYWFDETKGLISLKLLGVLILYAYRTEGKPLEILRMEIEEAKEIYAIRANGYCFMNKAGFPVVKNDKIALMSELCVDELQAIFNLIYQD